MAVEYDDAHGEKLEYRIVESVEGFGSLASHWHRLAAAGGVRTPYQSFAWLEQWLRYRGSDLQPFIIFLQDRETIAPLGRRGWAGLRSLHLLGAPDSDYIGLVTTRPIDEAWDSVGQVLAECRHRFDVVHLQSVRERDSIVSALSRHLHGQGRERVYERCPWIPTDRPWDEIRKSRGSGLRNELRRWERRIRELGELKVEQAVPPLDDELIDELESVERHSWKWEEGHSAFRNGPQREFVRAVLRDPRANVVMWLMRLSGRLVAFALVLVGRNRWYYYLPSFRKDVPNAGSLLLAQIVEAACASGCTVVDLLRGDHGYKLAWTNQVDTVHEIVWPSNLLGRGVTWVHAARWCAARSEYLRTLRSHLSRVGDRRRRSRSKKDSETITSPVSSIGSAAR